MPGIGAGRTGVGIHHRAPEKKVKNWRKETAETTDKKKPPG
jgi:hypothetical protein